MKRPPIPTAMKSAAWKKNNGFCTWPGCARKGDILEHLLPWAFVFEHRLENLEPRCTDHAKEKTRDDIKRIRKATRQAGEYGSQYARRKRNGPQLKSRGFDKSLRKKMNGEVVRT
jgi:hypothetical protein